MVAAIKRVIIPDLRSRGFRGSLPHFRRQDTTHVDLLSIQFSRWGGEFVVEVARAPSEGVTLGSGKFIPPSQLNAHHVLRRLRLGAADMNSDHWFKFDDATTTSDFDRVASEVPPLIATQAESFRGDA